MTKEDAIQIESSQRQHHEVLEHQDRAYLINQSIIYNRFAILKPKLFKDGTQWCVLYGEDIVTGIAGFGNTPDKAITDWDRQWHKEI